MKKVPDQENTENPLIISNMTKPYRETSILAVGP